MTQTELFHKLVVLDTVSRHILERKLLLQQELLAKASDPVILKRRFRMLSQLADYESQIYKKIYNFQNGDIEDYVNATKLILEEIQNVVDRSG